jgi:hypothetical protein
MGQVVLSGPQRAMLTALAFADDEGLKDGRLARAAGYKSQTSANRAFAAAGHLIANYLSVDAPSTSPGRDGDGSTFLGYRAEQKTEAELGNWILHAELREAVRSVL